MKKNKPTAYYKKIVSNSKKNEYRQNDNAAKYIFPAGLMADSDWSYVSAEQEFNRYMEYSGPEDWLTTFSNEKLAASMQNLHKQELELVYMFFVCGYTQKEVALHLGISQPAIHKKWSKIRKIIKTLMNEL